MQLLKFSPRYLCLLMLSLQITNAEHRVKKDINLIKYIVLTKIFGNQFESKSRPIFVQENLYRNPEGLLSVGKEEIKIKIPKEDEEPFLPEYVYKQIRNDGSAIVYTLNDKNQVLVSDTRNQQNILDSSEYARNKPALSSFQARLKPSKPCKESPYFAPVSNTFRQMMYSMPHPDTQNPDYLYKVIHKDGSVMTHFGTGEVQEQKALRKPTSNINRIIQNSQLYVLNKIANSVEVPFMPKNMLFREEIEPVKVIDAENQLPDYPLPPNEQSSNIVPNEVVYLTQPSNNIPVRIKSVIEQIDDEQARQDSGNELVPTVTSNFSHFVENSSETVESVSDLVNKLAESHIESLNKNVTPLETTSDDSSSSTKETYPSLNADNQIEGTTVQMSTSYDIFDEGKRATNGNSLDTSRGDVPSFPN